MINKYSQMESPAAASSCSSTTTSKSLSHSATSASSSPSLQSHQHHHHHHGQHHPHHHSASASASKSSTTAPAESSSSSSLPCGSAGSSTTASTTQPSAKPLKRKLFTAPPPGSGAEDEDKKAWTPKRRRSVQQEGSLSPSSTSANTSGTTPGSAGSKTPGRLTVPLSERQQMALILQMSAEESSHQAESATSPRPSSPQSVGKKTPLERKVNKQNGKGETPLHVAAINGDARQTKKLIKAGADVNIKDYAGWTPLHEACNRGHLDVAKQLLKAGANVNAQGLENDTPLHDASVNGHPKLVELLLRHGANPLQANDRGKVAVDLASNDHITKLLKNDMIASSSSSDSGTSDIRSPTSPESNAASDREEDKDVEALSVSLKKYRESADSSSSSKLMSSMSSGGGSSNSPPKASDTYSSIMQAAGLHTDTTIPRTATPLVDTHRAGLHNTSIFNTARGGSYHSPSSHRQGAPGSTAGSHRGSSVSPGSRATSTSSSSRGSATSGQTGGAVPPVHSAGLATTSALSPSGRSHHHGHHHGHHGGNSVNSSSVPSSSSTLSHPTSSSHSSSSMSSSFHSGSNAVPGQSSFGFTPGSATHTGGPFGLGSGHMASHNLPPHGPHPQQPHSSSNIFKKVHMTHHMDKSSSPRLMLKFHHIRNKEKMGESPKRLKQNTGEAAPRTYSVTLGMGGRAEEYDEFDMKGDRAPSRAESTSSQDSEAFTEVQHRVTSYGSTKRSHPSSASPGPADTQQGSSPSMKVSSSNSNVSQSLESRTNKSSDTGPSSTAPVSAGSSGIKDTTTAADSQMPTLSHERDRFSPEFEDISDSEDMDTTSKSTSHNKSHIGTSNIPSSSSSGKSGQSKGDVSSSSTSVSGESKGASRSQHITSSSSASPYTFNSSSSGSSPTSSTVSSRGGKHDKGKHKESQQGKQDEVSGSREKTDNVDNSSKSDKSHKVSTSKDHDKSSKEIVSTSRASPKSDKDGYHSPKGHSPKGLSPKSDSSSKTELKSCTIKLEKDTKHEKPYTKVSSAERESSHSPKYIDKDVAKATSPKRYSPKLLKDKESSGNGKPSLKIDTNRGSPKPSSDRDSPKSANSDGRPPSPKVPPLKIIINPHKNPSNEGSHRSKESTRSRETTKTSTTLPYVINPTQEGANAEGVVEGQVQGEESNAGQQSQLQASKASRNSSRSSSLDGVEGKIGQHEDNKGDSSVVSSSGELLRSRKHRNMDEKSMDSSKSDDGGDRDEKDAAKEAEEAAAHERRLTRSQARSQKKDDPAGKDEENSNGPSETSTTSSAPPVVTTSSSTFSRSHSISAPAQVEHAPVKERPERDLSMVHMHPRKRKLRQRQLQREAEAAASSDMSSFNPFPSNKNMDKQANPYNMYLDIRKKVYRRHSEWNVVTPKAPQGFKDYLMVSCNYVLQGNAASKLAVPLLGAPNSLEGPMRELFMDQEKARYKLRLQHVIEREKLMLSIEQETLRVHGRAARAMANQSTPLSVCSILRDEEIYNPIEVEDDKDKDKRQRYNGRQFLSWLQDVDDKFEKIKESLLLRHHHEAESLHAVQKLEWEWKLKELGLCDHRTTPSIDMLHVPMVQVSDEFDLLPA